MVASKSHVLQKLKYHEHGVDKELRDSTPIAVSVPDRERR
jgi:hypothetical protein